VNLGACQKLERRLLTGLWYRAVDLDFLNSPVDIPHTKCTFSRCSPGPYGNPPFAILYFGETLQVTLFEFGAMLGDPYDLARWRNAPGSFAAFHVNVVLQQVADLTVLSQQDLLQTTVEELTGDWKGYRFRGLAGATVSEPVGTAPTQDLGEALFGVPGVEAFQAVSAKLATQRTLVVFPDKLFRKSHLEIMGPSNRVIQVIDGKLPKTARHGWSP
jgi:hypothetical protein